MAMPQWLKSRSVLLVVILAAVLLEVISTIQYSYTRGIMEQELERRAYSELVVSVLNIEEVLAVAEVTAQSQRWHAERNLDNPDYMNLLVNNIVRADSEIIVGAGIGFKPDYYPEKGRLFEPYAHQVSSSADSIILEQIGARHDYTKVSAYKTAIYGDTAKWTLPYMEKGGLANLVATYSLPIYDKNHHPVAVLGVEIPVDWIDDAVNEHHTYPSSFSLVLSAGGTLIADAPDSMGISDGRVEKVVRLINDSTFKKELKANGHVKAFTFHDDEVKENAHVYYVTKPHDPHWQVVLVCYDNEVFGLLKQMRRHNMWKALVSLVLLGIIIHLFMKNAKRLRKTELRQERINSELRIASDIQMHMLPQEDSIASKDVTVKGLLAPARAVGGDLYDFFIRDEKLFFCIGDVSGKGVPAAIVMAVIHSLFRSASVHENNPARIMHVINETACQRNEDNIFVTFFVGVLDLPTGRLRYCNAGHDKPMVLTAQQTIDTLNEKPNLPLGVFEDVGYVMREYLLEKGSTLFLYTDGLTEAKNIQRRQFGLERVVEVAKRALPVEKPDELLQAMQQALNRFVEGAEPSDDLTLLAIRYTPTQQEDVMSEMLTLQNDPHQVALLSSFVKDLSARLQLEPSFAKQMRLAVEEAVVNVMDYAYPAGAVGDITIEAKSDSECLKFIISDTGVFFDPTESPLVDTTLTAEERPIGGLGLLLVRQYVDSVNYERIEGKNILTLRKNYHS